MLKTVSKINRQILYVLELVPQRQLKKGHHLLALARWLIVELSGACDQALSHVSLHPPSSSSPATRTVHYLLPLSLSSSPPLFHFVGSDIGLGTGSSIAWGVDWLAGWLIGVFARAFAWTLVWWLGG
jgi:hypothetical protein